MTEFKNQAKNPLEYTTIKKADRSHIEILDPDRCLNKCEGRPCTFFCPANVFTWNGDKINVHYGRCLECGACPWGCPHENIKWSFPPGGWGVIYGKKQ